MFLKMVDINNILTKYYLNETQVIFNTNISSIEEFEKSGYYDIYTLFASTIYLIGLFVIGFIMIILSDINKCMYIKYVCRNQRTWFTLTLFIFTFFFFINSIFGWTIMTICLQLLFKINFDTIEQLMSENYLSISNYDESMDRVETIITIAD